MALSDGQYTFTEIFAEYYAIFRNRTTNLPAFGDREYTIAIHLGNEAIKKWARGAEAMLPRELIDLGSRQTTGVWPTVERTFDTGKLTHAMPTNMRKPPKFIRVGTGTTDIEVIPPEEALDVAPTSASPYFIGGANNRYTLVIPSSMATQYDGETMDFVYDKNPTFLQVAETPAATVIEMSDPAFMIHRMVQMRATRKAGVLYTVAKAEATECLQAMKIENMNERKAAWNSLASSLGGQEGQYGQTARGAGFFGVR